METSVSQLDAWIRPIMSFSEIEHYTTPFTHIIWVDLHRSTERQAVSTSQVRFARTFSLTLDSAWRLNTWFVITETRAILPVGHVGKMMWLQVSCFYFSSSSIKSMCYYVPQLIVPDFKARSADFTGLWNEFRERTRACKTRGWK